MLKRRTEVYTIPAFLNNEAPKRIEGIRYEAFVGGAIGLTSAVATMVIASHIHPALADTVTPVAVPAVSPLHSVSKTFDTKIWPMFLDIGDPLAKTMMAIGIYKCIRGDVDKGWKTVYRAGIGLVGLYLISGAVHILQGVGANLEVS